MKPHVAESSDSILKELTYLLRRYGWDVLVLVVMGILLYDGMVWQYFDPDSTNYECYAVAFWRGIPAALQLPQSQCGFLASFPGASTLVKQMQAAHWSAPLIHFVAGQSTSLPLHTFEYPLPTMITFSLPLLASHDWYEVAFALLMSLVAVGVYVLLRRFRSKWAAMVFALYLVVGAWGTADGRFDLLPSALTLVAILCGVHKRWHWAFAVLAMATVFKLYPAVLLIPLLLTQQMESHDRWSSWRRWTPLAVFAAICIAVMALSLFLSVESTLAAFTLYQDRSVQVESLVASVLWMLSFLGYPLHPLLTPTSLDVLSPLASQVSLIDTLLLGAGLVYVWWLQWRGKTDLATSCLLTLLIFMVTSKVFSTQYLIWLLPLAAYVGERDPKWVAAWCLLGGYTTFIFPYLYTSYMTPLIDDGASSAPIFLSVIAIRNLILLGITLSLLFYYARKQPAYTKRYFFIGRGVKRSIDKPFLG